MAVCFIPFTIITVYLLSVVYQFSERYDIIVNNITRANAYSIDFKENVDYTMYVIVVNSERASELVDINLPHDLISEARSVFLELSENASNDYAKNQL